MVLRPSNVPAVQRALTASAAAPGPAGAAARVALGILNAYQLARQLENYAVTEGATTLQGYTFARQFNYSTDVPFGGGVVVWRGLWRDTNTESPLYASGETYNVNALFGVATSVMPAPVQPADAVSGLNFVRKIDMVEGTSRWGSRIHEIWTKNVTGPYGVVTVPGAAFPMEVPSYPALPAYQPVLSPVAPGMVPRPMIRPWRKLRDRLSPDPYASPRPGRQPKALAPPSVMIEIPPQGAPRLRPAPAHRFAPPRFGEKEKKAVTKYQAAWDTIGKRVGFDAKKRFDQVTEALDLLNAVYYGLPEELRTPGASPQQMALDLVEHWSELQPDVVMRNILLMELQDRAIGGLSSGAKKGLFAAGGDINFFGPLL